MLPPRRLCFTHADTIDDERRRRDASQMMIDAAMPIAADDTMHAAARRDAPQPGLATVISDCRISRFSQPHSIRRH